MSQQIERARQALDRLRDHKARLDAETAARSAVDSEIERAQARLT